jgi:hypothetical protein
MHTRPIPQRRQCVFACLALCLLSLSTRAQVAGVATIQGVVTDNSGAILVGAEVQVTNIETGVSLKAVTNEDGLYRLSSFSPGRYSIEARAKGFAPARLTEVRLEVGQTARIDLTLIIGNVNETVEITAQSTLLNSETTDVGQVIDGKRIVEMPLNGRNYLQLAQLTAGVLPAGNSRTSDEGGFLAFGQHTYQNNVLLDGADNSSRASGGPLGFESQAVKPPVDAVSEFKVLTNNTSAEFGYSTGAWLQPKVGQISSMARSTNSCVTMRSTQPISSRTERERRNPSSNRISSAALSADRF